MKNIETMQSPHTERRPSNQAKPSWVGQGDSSNAILSNLFLETQRPKLVRSRLRLLVFLKLKVLLPNGDTKNKGENIWNLFLPIEGNL